MEREQHLRQSLETLVNVSYGLLSVLSLKTVFFGTKC